MHLAQQRHEDRRLARSRRADDQVKGALLELHLVVDAQAECLPRGCQGAVVLLVGPGEVCFPAADIAAVLPRRVDDDFVGRSFGVGIQ